MKLCVFSRSGFLFRVSSAVVLPQAGIYIISFWLWNTKSALVHFRDCLISKEGLRFSLSARSTFFPKDSLKLGLNNACWCAHEKREEHFMLIKCWSILFPLVVCCAFKHCVSIISNGTDSRRSTSCLAGNFAAASQDPAVIIHSSLSEDVECAAWLLLCCRRAWIIYLHRG